MMDPCEPQIACFRLSLSPRIRSGPFCGFRARPYCRPQMKGCCSQFWSSPPEIRTEGLLACLLACLLNTNRRAGILVEYSILCSTPISKKGSTHFPALRSNRNSAPSFLFSTTTSLFSLFSVLLTIVIALPAELEFPSRHPTLHSCLIVQELEAPISTFLRYRRSE